MTAALALTFDRSADTVDQLPFSHAEVAVAGRSNVGKSSLLNAVAGQKALARTSSTPGRTRALNSFTHAGGGTLVDLPGYGYAKASKADRAALLERTRTYLLEREHLVRILLLVDGAVGPTPIDLGMLEWLRRHDLPFTVVATKHDKVKSSKRERRKREVADGCGLERSEVVWTSATKGTNIPRLRELVRELLGA